MGSIANSVPGNGLPVPNPCLSFWQQTTRSFRYLNHNESQAVPDKSKFVIVGSGISGALTSFELIENGVPAEDITILEAREAASGASSRNAGHVRPGKSYQARAFASIHIYIHTRILINKIRCFPRVSSIQTSPWQGAGTQDYRQRAHRVQPGM